MIQSPLYNPLQEHDACGVGLIANIQGEKSHNILKGAIEGLKNLAHRGAIDADAVTGDGAGILTQIPHQLFRKFLEENGKSLYKDTDLGVGMLFLPLNDPYAQAHGKHIVEEAVKAEGLSFLAWREVPIDNSCLGKKAELSRPLIVQALVAKGSDMSDDEYERALFLSMRACTRRAGLEKLEDFYICSFSCRTITYKGLFNAPQVRKFFLDIRNPEYITAYAIFHQRFATNTFPDWQKAQPYRMMAHNGEINTIRGNRNSMKAREFSEHHGVWGDRYKDLAPMVQEGMSDSASFDNSLQVMSVSGRSCIEGVSMMMPSAWENDFTIPENIRAFHRYQSVVMEPWDGPAAIAFTDGKIVGASLDRNGLRPARYKVYEDDTFILASEVGLVRSWKAPVIESGRLGPGKMLAIDFEQKKIIKDDEVKQKLASQNDYPGWCDRNLLRFADENTVLEPEFQKTSFTDDKIVQSRIAFGYDKDEEEIIVKPMLENGLEAIGSMGEDTPLAVMSRKSRLLYTYFKQIFAQVTNPAIDSLRERQVMSVHMHLGGRLGLFQEFGTDKKFVTSRTPIIVKKDYDELQSMESFLGKVVELDATFPIQNGPEGLEEALRNLAIEAVKQQEVNNARIITITDENLGANRCPIPMLLAVGAVHQELVRKGKRMDCDIIAKSGEARDVHQIACLLGFGANVVYPYFLFELACDMVEKGVCKEGLTAEDAFNNYRHAIEKGILKIMAKMGISTLFSYHSAQNFEAVGLSKSVIDDCFPGTASPIDGIGYRHIAEESLARHEKAFNVEEPKVDSDGFYKVAKKGDVEFRAWNSKVISGMNKFVRSGGDIAKFEPFKEASNNHQPVTIKDLLAFKYSEKEIDLCEVEAIEDIRCRFTTAAMSMGALSPEAHEALAIAMNRIGGKSNSGEGGEDPIRFRPYENGDLANSAIKQVASGRFGVTAEYLSNAKEIEIKVAQGAKPGEGGQLPGHKVSQMIATLRYSVPGVTLISPPPHHDIYSIEDLAQLIFDLKTVNPRAKVCVKLVSGSGIGTIAAGVAKAYADVILVSGHDGGTGASPISSVKHAGSAWEIGLAETHQVLMMNELRNRVVLRTDGGMKTGRDIVIAAILGAEEFNFGTAALIAAGCAMFRVCHLNTCPVGVATQREDLRAKFRGKPENIVNYFNAVAEDVRGILAKLGVKSLNDIIGRTEYLKQIDDPLNPKTKTINLSGLLHNPDPTFEKDRFHTRERNDRFGNEGSLDDDILQDAIDTITHKSTHFNGSYKVKSTNRDVGTRVSGEIAYLHGNKGMQPGYVNLNFKGTAGQSFGTFLVQGVRMSLIGDANDYVGKGMAGGEIIIRPSDQDKFVWSENILIGNTCLYGATGGVLFAAGQAGERFAVRNSGGTAVVEGLGDHGSEYMTGGTVVCLGETGVNFGAGMSGGMAFIFDEADHFDRKYNPEMISISRLDENEDIENLSKLIHHHAELTKSPKAQDILKNWDQSLQKFWKVAPTSVPEGVPTTLKLTDSVVALTV